ncbi:MAG: DUF1080 domain-containing protein [Gemmataceae bacterium]
MLKKMWLSCGLVLCCLGVVSAAEKERVLFNGKDLSGWVPEGTIEYKDADGQTHPIWTVRDGVLVCDGRGGGFLRFDQEFSDFALHLEYRFEPPATPQGRRGNSGVGIRTRTYDPKQSMATRPSYYSYEVQLLDDADKPATPHSTASLYRYVAPKTNAAKPAPEWNSMDIECVGPRIRVVLNGQEVINIDQSTIPALKDKPLKGYVNLQNHGSKVEFRNIRIKDLSASTDQ